jgi:hypothetical protein
LHLGEISLECSRAGAAAVALWATMRMFPLTRKGQLARGLEAGRSAAITLFEKIQNDQRFLTSFPPELDIVLWAPMKGKVSEISTYSKKIFEAAAKEDLHLALATLPKKMLNNTWDIDWDHEHVTCLRSCIMKAEHGQWIDHIWKILDEVMRAIYNH